MHELPLVIFTVLAQTATGAFLLLLVANKMTQITDKQLAIGLFASMCIFGIGMFASMVHLGQLSRAFNVLSGIGRSPMSNEVLCAMLFAILGGLSSLFMLINKGPKALWHLCAMLAAVAGLALAFFISQVYNISTVSTWANNYTTIYMLLTVFICGGAIAALMGSVRLGALVGAISIVISLTLKVNYFADIWSANSTLAMAQIPWLMVQLAALAVGLMLASIISVKQCSCKLPLILFTGVVLIAELCGRVAFYNLWTITM